MNRTERRERERELQLQNRIPVLAQVTPQILSLGTKPFVIFMDALFKGDAYFQKVVKSFYPLFRNKTRIE